MGLSLWDLKLRLNQNPNACFELKLAYRLPMVVTGATRSTATSVAAGERFLIG